jgi:hypothetical protein
VNVAITAADDAVLFKVLATNQTYPRTGDVTEISFTLPPGTHPIDVIPVSQFQPPIGAANRDGATRSVSVTAVGSPSYTSSGTAAGTANSITLNDSFFERNSSPVADEKYVAWRVGEGEPSCVMVGATVQVNGGISSASRTIPVPTEENYFIKACGTNAYGVVQSEPRFADSYPTPTAPGGDLSYSVGITPVASAAGVREYVLQKAPAPAIKNKYDVVYTRGAQSSTDFASLLTLDSAPGISAAYCRDRFIVGYTCELSSTVSPTGAPTLVRVDFPTTCRTVANATETNLGWVSQAARNNAVIVAKKSADGTTVTYTVTFTGNFSSLQPAVSDAICITPDAPPPVVPGDTTPVVP